MRHAGVEVAEHACNQVTKLLAAWRGGDDEALRALLPLVYNDLRLIALRYMRRERMDHTWQPSDLLHAVFVNLPKIRNIDWKDRFHFFAISANLMRRELVKHANRRTRRRSAESLHGPPTEEDEFVIAVNDAIEKLKELDSELASIVEMKFFADRTIPEIAQITGLSEATVKRRWRVARGWLHNSILGSEPKAQSE